MEFAGLTTHSRQMLKDGPGTAKGHTNGRTDGRRALFPINSFFPACLAFCFLFFFSFSASALCGRENIFDADNKKHWRATACGKYIDKRHAPTTNTMLPPPSGKVTERQREEKECSVARGPSVWFGCGMVKNSPIRKQMRYSLKFNFHYFYESIF